VRLRAVLLAWGLLAFALTDLGGPSPLVFAVVFGFVCAGPGLAIVAPTGFHPFAATAIAAIGASVSLAALVTIPLLYLGEYDATLVIALLASITVLVVALAPVRERDEHAA